VGAGRLPHGRAADTIGLNNVARNLRHYPGDCDEALQVDSQPPVFDRYDRDAGKGVSINPIGIPDGQMGRLHTVGLAREFEVRGTSIGPSADFTVAP
jgi:hypothetical protein